MKHLSGFFRACISQKITVAEKTVLNIMEQSKYEVEVCRLGISLLKEQNSFEGLLYPIAKASHSSDLLPLLLSRITLTAKTDKELIALIKQSGYDDIVCHYMIPFFRLETKTELELLEIMEQSKYGFHMCDAIIPLLKISEKKESWRWALVQNSVYNWTICRLLIPYLSASNALKVMQRFNYRDHISEIGVLRLKKKKEIMEVIVGSKFDLKTCINGIPMITDEKTKMTLMKKSNYHPFVANIVVPTLKQKANMWLAFETCQNNFSTCEVLFPICKKDEDILALLEKHHYMSGICPKAIPFLKDDDNIIFVLGKNFFSNDALKIAIKELNLKKRDEPGLWELMEKAKYDDGFCSKVLPYLHFEKKTDVEIMEILKQKKYPEGLCRAASIYLEEQNNLISIANKIGDDCQTMLSIIPKLSQNSIDEIFLKVHHLRILVEMCPFASQSALLKQIESNRYSEEFCNAATAALLKEKKA